MHPARDWNIFLLMTNCFEFPLHPDDLRWAAGEGVSETVIAAVLLLHERSVEQIVAELSAAELEQVIKLVGRSPSVYPPGTLEALKSKRNASPTPMAESRAKKQTPSTARADHPLREQTRVCRGFSTAAQQTTIEHVGGAAASQNTAAVTDQPAAPTSPTLSKCAWHTNAGSQCSARTRHRAIRSSTVRLRLQ